MLSVSKEYLQSIGSDTRDMPYRLTLSGSVLLDESRVTSLSVNENVAVTALRSELPTPPLSISR